jgi:hypothetical protein
MVRHTFRYRFVSVYMYMYMYIYICVCVYYIIDREGGLRCGGLAHTVMKSIIDRGNRGLCVLWSCMGRVCLCGRVSCVALFLCVCLMYLMCLFLSLCLFVFVCVSMLCVSHVFLCPSLCDVL